KPVADADLAIKSGFYSLPVAMGAANSPLPGSSGSLEVINAGSDDGYVTQKWTQSNDTPDNRIFVRHKRGAAGAWTPWIEMSTTSTGLFTKADTDKPIFEISTDIVTSQSFNVGFDNILIRVNSGVSVVLQALVPATDYKIYCDVDGGLEAISWDTAQPANTILVGGFHAGHTDGIVNPATIWDLKWRPSCSPRGMTLSPDKRLWVDIYLMDVDYGINGYSRGDVTIADGASPPKIPAIYGGNGTTTYGSLTWYEAWDLAIAAGKRLPFYGEFTGFAYGVVEQQSTGADPVTTKYQAGHRSACGVEQVTGALWQWGADINGTTATGTVSWQDITDGRGSVYTHSIRAVRLGASWAVAANAGSRASSWYGTPDDSADYISARSVCEHLKL
ncbi:MAG: hypothetical protein IBX55_19935, partial [Methyloprofundus sp.]|nr:hypothetical protein [Methyloprofundus sp.]